MIINRKILLYKYKKKLWKIMHIRLAVMFAKAHTILNAKNKQI